ncbi:unnamed protein product [Penicillium salamii]|nr:unnamed protein product [Penicillium salamii]
MAPAAQSNEDLPSPREKRMKDEHHEELEIELRYLTFETPLPPLQPNENGVIGPELPDLGRCTSPFAWSRARKIFITWLSCLSTLVTTYTPGAYTAGLDQYKAEWHVDTTMVYTGITTFTLCFAISPMVLAPFSEIQGRRPVFVTAGIVYVISQIGSGVTASYAGMLVTRALAGVSCSVFSTMVGGVVSDIYEAAERNTAMSIFTGAALCGTGLGPLVSSIIAQHTSWRWIFYVQAISCGVVVMSLIFFFNETRGSVLLSRKAKALNTYYDTRERVGLEGLVESLDNGQKLRIRWKVKADEERATVLVLIKTSLLRPLRLLWTESVVFWFSLWMSFAWSILYMTFEAIPLVFSVNHDFNREQNGLVFISISVASLIAAGISVFLDHVSRRKRTVSQTPEGRLYPACLQSMLLPIGLFWLGWTLFPSVHWIVPVLAVGCITIGIFSVYLAVFNYLADTYHVYSSSAIAAQSFCRNVFAAVLPLCTDQMFNALTFQGASSLLGGVGVALSIVPWVLVFYGPRIRARSRLAGA